MINSREYRNSLLWLTSNPALQGGVGMLFRRRALAMTLLSVANS